MASDRQAGNAITLSLGAGGITAFYAVVVYGAFRVVRASERGTRYHLFLDELPDCRDLVDLCNGVYMARSRSDCLRAMYTPLQRSTRSRQSDLLRETELFESVIRLYRSPEALLTLTGGELKHD